MSGGHLDYKPISLGSELFNRANVHYDHEDSKIARKENPLEDKELSEMCYDFLCLLHSFEWYKSGDIEEESYRKDASWFKQKWISRNYKEALESYKSDLYEAFSVINKELSEYERIH